MNKLSKQHLNFFFLALHQGINYVIPIILMPYILSVLGERLFGVYSMVIVVSFYLQLTCDFGFNLTATRDIARQSSKNSIDTVFSEVTTAKFLLTLVAISLFSIVTMIVPLEIVTKKLLLLSFLSVGISSMLPLWYFQGVERMGYITLLSIGARLIAVLPVFFWVNEPIDILKLPILQITGALISLLMGIYILFFIEKRSFIKPTTQSVITQFVAGRTIFFSNIAIQVYKTGSVFVIGGFIGPEVAGLFYLGKKIVDACNNIAGILLQTALPYVVKVKETSVTKLHKILKKIFLFILFYTSIIVVLLIGNVDLISSIFTNGSDIFSTVLIILSFVVLIIGINVPAVLLLLAYKKDREYLNALLVGAAVSIPLTLLMVWKCGYIGAALSILIIETLVTIMLYTRTKDLR